jgi:hypothetical protein
MNSSTLNAFAAGMSAVAALAALFVAWLSLGESKRASAAAHHERVHAMDSALQARLDPMYPELRRVLGHLDDGVPREIRHVLVPFFVLFSDAYSAHRDGLLSDHDWNGFGTELAYWAQKSTARRAWKAFRLQTWTDGFADHVDQVLAGPPAYPDVLDMESNPPHFDWPADTP